jgi:hypothetical protein
VSNQDVKQDALDNLADALSEDILNTPDNDLLREVAEDYGDQCALANKFDQILERAEKQVFGTARSAGCPQVRSSVLDLPISLPDETIRPVKGIFDLGSRLSELPHTRLVGNCRRGCYFGAGGRDHRCSCQRARRG